MSMRAKIDTDVNGNIIVRMEGSLDFDNNIPLRHELQRMVTKNPAIKVILDLQGIDFVGSSGIVTFFETVTEINRKKNSVRLTNVRKEFIKVFKIYDSVNLADLILNFEEEDDSLIEISRKNGNEDFDN
ncbi:MAG: STAS domain-containing protein [Bacteriovoracaceae bacterium]